MNQHNRRLFSLVLLLLATFPVVAGKGVYYSSAVPPAVAAVQDLGNNEEYDPNTDVRSYSGNYWYNWWPAQYQYWQQYYNQLQQTTTSRVPPPTTTTTTTTPRTTTTTTTTPRTTTTTTTPRTTTTRTTTTTPFISSTECGISGIGQRFVSRIVGGFPASTNEFPWQAAVQRSDGAFCGGVIIDATHVLTAAHCISAGSSYSVGVGSTSLRIALTLSVSVIRVVVHPNYISSSLINDIAILTLSRPLDFSNPAIGPACLPSSFDDVNNFDVCEVSGWGATDPNIATLTDSLQRVTVPIVSDAECSARYNSVFGPERFCAGDIVSGGRDSCQGDSGGPLVCLSNGRYTVYGLVSSGISCARAQFPGIYTEVTSYVAWIRQNL